MSNAAVVPIVSPLQLVPTVSPGQRLNVNKVDTQLTIANGMTAGYGDNDGKLDNWPFDPRIFGQWRHQPIRVGFIRNITALPSNGQIAAGPQDPAGLYTLYFMYNPNQISINWTMNLNQAAPLYLYGQDLSTSVQSAATPSSTTTVPNYAGAQSVGWSLYFDRTYEMMYGESGGNPQDDRGVLRDVAALYNLMGAYIGGAGVPFSVPCEVVFGQNHGGQLFGFTGYISTMAITYGIFRHDMIPSRAEVDLTMTATYVSNQVAPAGGGSTTPANTPSTAPVSVNPNTGVASVQGAPVGAN